MRAVFVVIGAIGVASALGSAPAEAGDHPFCLKSPEYLSPAGYCAFDTFQQCEATASGRLADCDVNPFYAGNAATWNEPVRRRHHRRHYRYD